MFLLINIKAQTTPGTDWYTPAWNWQDGSNANWVAKTSVGNGIFGITQMASPFTSNGSSADINSIALADDYRPKQGWVLLFKDFGYVDFSNSANSANVDYDLPLFILYNKYTGTIRCFFYTTAKGSNINSAVAKLFWNSPNSPSLNNSLLTLGKNYPQANGSYPKPSNTDSHFNYLDYPNGPGWFSTEFKVHFDPNTNRNTYGQQVVFKFQLGTSSSVALNGGFVFTTQSATANEESINGLQSISNNTTYENFAIAAKKFLGKIPKKSEVEGAFTSIANAVNTIDGKYCNNFTRDLHNVNNSLQNGNLKKFIVGAAGFVPYVSQGLTLLSTVVDMFTNKSPDPNNNQGVAANDDLVFQPTISQGQINLSGNISVQYAGKSLFLQLPGTKHKNGNNIFYPGLPYYDCPLGVVSLHNTPNLKKRSYSTTSTTNYIVGSFFSQCCNGVPVFNPSTAASFGQYMIHNSTNNYNTFYRNTTCTKNNITQVVSYKLDEILQLDFNLASDATITSSKVALMFEIQPTTTSGTIPSIKPANIHNKNFSTDQSQCLATTDLWPDLSPGIGTNYISGSSETGYTNFTRKNLNDGILKISNFDNVNKLHKFQTQFVDIDKANGLSATFEDGNVKVYVKILIVLKPNDPLADQTPITQLFTYEVKNFTNDNTSNTPYPSICSQLEEIEDEAKASLCNGTNVTVATGNLSGTSITNLCDLTVNPHLNSPNGTSDFQADNYIKFKPPFKTTVAGNDLFVARINGTGSCLASTNALQVNTFFGGCDPNPSNYRLINQNSNDSLNTPAPKTKGTIYSLKDVDIVNANLKMIVAPNPNTGSFKLIFNKLNPAGTVIIKNSIQQIVYSASIKEDEFIDINLGENYASGVYFIIFTDGRGVQLTQKMIKE